MHLEFLPFAAWLCRVQREDGRGVCSVLPHLLPGLAGSLGDLGSIPSLLQPLHLHKKAQPLVQGFPVPVHVCEDGELQTDAQISQPEQENSIPPPAILHLCALDPLLSLFLALILLEQAGPSWVWISRGWEHHLLSFRSCWGLAWEQQKEQRWWGREGPAESPWFKCYFEFTKSKSVFFLLPLSLPLPPLPPSLSSLWTQMGHKCRIWTQELICLWKRRNLPWCPPSRPRAQQLLVPALRGGCCKSTFPPCLHLHSLA